MESHPRVSYHAGRRTSQQELNQPDHGAVASLNRQDSRRRRQRHREEDEEGQQQQQQRQQPQPGATAAAAAVSTILHNARHSSFTRTQPSQPPPPPPPLQPLPPLPQPSLQQQQHQQRRLRQQDDGAASPSFARSRYNPHSSPYYQRQTHQPYARFATTNSATDDALPHPPSSSFAPEQNPSSSTVLQSSAALSNVNLPRPLASQRDKQQQQQQQQQQQHRKQQHNNHNSNPAQRHPGEAGLVTSTLDIPAHSRLHSDAPPSYDQSQQHLGQERPSRQTFTSTAPLSYQQPPVPLLQEPPNLNDDPQFSRDEPTQSAQSPAERARALGYSHSLRTNSTVTPGADNLGESAAGGGIAGIAYGVASANERDSGLRALKALQGQRASEPGGRDRRLSMDREDNPYVPEPPGSWRRGSGPPTAAMGAVRRDSFGPAASGGVAGSLAAAAQPERQYSMDQFRGGNNPAPTGYDSSPYANRAAYDPHRTVSSDLLPPPPPPVNPFGSRASLASSVPSTLPDDAVAGGITPHRKSLPPIPYPAAAAGATAGAAAGSPALRPMAPYADSPMARRSQLLDHSHESFDPNDIEDDGDDGLQEPYNQQQGRRSVLDFMRNKSRSSLGSNGGAAAAGAAAGAGAGIGATLGGMGSRNASGRYSAVQTSDRGVPGAGDMEKSEWLKSQQTTKKRKWIIAGGIVLILAAIIGAVVGGIFGSRAHAKSADSASSAAAQDDPDDKGLLTADSSQIKALMNNKDLHRVFPGMAYTPLNAQYPACLSNPVSQNNVTKDVAIMSQLTNTIRLYGTDCNQTDLVLAAFDLLKLKDMRVWPAIWLDNNSTTNDRGLRDMQSILDTHGGAPFEGVIVGNEVLFRKDLTPAQLTDIIGQTRRNLTEKGINLPVAVADLGDNWTADLAAQVDVVMSNVHPFFGGVPVGQGAGWAWDFWQTHDVVLTTSNTTKKNIISEIGWPSGGGNDCGEANCTTPDEGAVSGIDEMNQFMADFVCQSLQNGTDYFWFEAFDEPWKVQFNEPGKEWEDKWGLMDANRGLKKGLKIPTCPGMSIPSRKK